VKNKIKQHSELRQDLVTGDWVVIAAARKDRPNKKGVKPAWENKDIPNQKECLFCRPEETGQEKDVLIYRDINDEWTTRVFPNKYPAFKPLSVSQKIKHREEGPFFSMDGVGYHELVVTRDHDRQIGDMETVEVAEILDAYQARYLDLMNKKFVRYIEIFHNYGKAAGGSIYHPHSQLMAFPIVSPYIKAELDGAEQYERETDECVYCTMLKYELTEGKRIVYENDDFVAFCPFASRKAYEVWVIPKKHMPYFERITDEEKMSAAEALKESLRKLGVVLDKSAYNFYLHTSPCDGRDYNAFHWHFEILPKTSIWAGFELSTGIEINAVAPEIVAKELRNV
jgi:UDPglucose--hexose-1-phosphate uridylyltransferase